MNSKSASAFESVFEAKKLRTYGFAAIGLSITTCFVHHVPETNLKLLHNLPGVYS